MQATAGQPLDVGFGLYDLRAAGHHHAPPGVGLLAFTPTLTGMGERAHLSHGEPVGIGTHIDDIVAVLEFECLRDVVLCGASYGGISATGAADRAADRVRLLVYIDGLVPVPGRPAINLFPARIADMIRNGIAEHGSAWRVPMPAGLSMR